MRFHVRYLPSILLNLGTVSYHDEMFNDGVNSIFAPIGLFYNDFLDFSQKDMAIFSYTSFSYYLGNRVIGREYCIRVLHTDSSAHLAIYNGTSNSNHKTTNWTSHNFTTSNMHTFATEFGNCIKINYNSSGVPFNLSEDLNLILFSGYARDFETGNNTSDEYIVPIVYEGNDPNADEIIEV